MKIYSSAVQSYLESGKPCGWWTYLRFTVKDSAGDAVNFDFSDMTEDETVTVIDPTDGSDSTRDYLGGTHINQVEEITYVEGNEITSIEIKLSFLSAAVKSMVRDHHFSRQRVEIHKGLIDAESRLLVDKPDCEWFGIVDTIRPIEDAFDPDTFKAIAPYYSVTVSNHLREFDRGNTALRNKFLTLERDDDEIGQYLREAGSWRLFHGKERKNRHERRKAARQKNEDGRTRHGSR